MKRNTRSNKKRTPSAIKRRIILCVDPDTSYADILHDAWSRLRLADELHVVRSQDEAMAFLTSPPGENGDVGTAAIVLDPDALGEATGSFVRAVRKHYGEAEVPIVFWTGDSEKYRVLEGISVQSVLKKPMVLRLIQSLDAACELRVHRFHPFAGNSPFEPAPPQSNSGAIL